MAKFPSVFNNTRVALEGHENYKNSWESGRGPSTLALLSGILGITHDLCRYSGAVFPVPHLIRTAGISNRVSELTIRS